ncbi:MAG: S8 family serine peptidase [Pseudomonadota bacterium]
MKKSLRIQFVAGALAMCGVGHAQGLHHHTAAERTAHLEHMHHAMMSHRAHREALHMHRMGMFDERMAMGVERLGSLSAPVYARRGEVLAMGLAPKTLTQLASEGWTLKQRRSFDQLDLSIDVLRAPKGLNLRRGLRRIAQVDRDAVVAPNALFMRSGDVQGPLVFSDRAPSKKAGEIGLIDTGADPEALRLRTNGALVQKCFADKGEVTPQDHGSLVAHIAAQSGAERLVVADVFCGNRDIAAAEAIVAAVDWLVGEGVKVVNISLAGPSNAIVEAAISRATERGHLFVASVGNDGNHRAPRYPAAYTNVVAVTAVDDNFALYRRANTGAAVDVAALGVNVAEDNNARSVSGTSFASPVVAAYLASRSAGSLSPSRARTILAETTIDVGEPGRDPMYGEGVLVVARPERIALADE